MSSEVYYKVIHYEGGLSVAEMQDFDEIDYTLASNKPFETERDAIDHARNLASANGLELIGISSSSLGILD